MSKVHLPQAPLSYSHTLRVTFAYDAQQITLQDVRRVAMRVPAPTTKIPVQRATGYWLAVEDGAGKIVYHVPLHDPLKYDREVFNDGTGGKPRRTPSTKRSGTFEVLVPDVPDGGRVVLHGPPHGPSAAATAFTAQAVPLTSHGFDELRQRAAAADRSPGGKQP